MPGILVHMRLRQEGCHEFEARLDYTQSSRSVWTNVSQNTKLNQLIKMWNCKLSNPFLSKEINKYCSIN